MTNKNEQRKISNCTGKAKFFHRKDLQLKKYFKKYLSSKQNEITNKEISHLLRFSRQHCRLENNGRNLQETSES